MRTLKFTKHENGRVELITRVNGNLFGIWFPVKDKEEYYEIQPMMAQDFIEA